MSVLLKPGFREPDLTPVGDWHPSRYTPSLSGTEDFPSEADRLLPFAARYWSSPELDEFMADPWQVWTLRHVLEVYPDEWPDAELRGQLRFRQVVISLARQNGKSVLGALLVLYFLCLHVRGPRVVGLASVDRQAKIVYDRVRYAVENNPVLSREIKATGTRGITRRDGTGIYQTLPAKEESAQGEPVTGCLYDELHLGLAALWDAMVLGQRARRNSMLVGITTAGDDDSALLIRLYDDGEAAIAGEDERFGFFVWEADDDELTEANVIRANPAVACGRIPLSTVMADAAKMWRVPWDKESGMTGRDRVIRYTLNRFVRGGGATWVPLPSFAGCAGTGIPAGHGEVPVYSIARTADWEFATVSATVKVDGRLHTEMVASLVAPDHDRLKALAQALASAGPATFALEARSLKALGDDLRDAGLEVWKLAETEMAAAAESAHAAIVRGAVRHANEPVLVSQMPKAKRRDIGDGWRISESLSTGHIDAVKAMVVGLYVAETRTQAGIQLF